MVTFIIHTLMAAGALSLAAFCVYAYAHELRKPDA